MPKSARGVRCTQHHNLHTGIAAIDLRTELPASPTAPSVARRFVREALAQWGYASLSETVTLLTSELVTNAVLHAGAAVALSVCADGGRLRVEVEDCSPRLPSTLHYEGVAQTGRGLALVERSAAEWGVRPTSGGKTVWFEVAL